MIGEGESDLRCGPPRAVSTLGAVVITVGRGLEFDRFAVKVDAVEARVRLVAPATFLLLLLA